MAGYKLLKRKGLHHDHFLIHHDDDFSDFPLSSPATKIRRLDAELPPIAEVELEHHEHDKPLNASVPIAEAEPEPVDAEAPNEERALVLFKPISHSLSPFSFTLNADLIAEIKNQVPWSKQRDSDCDRILKSAAEREEQDKKNRGMALVPWVPSTSTSPQFPILHDSNNSEMMEADELGGGAEGEAAMEMDVEQEDTSSDPTTSPLVPDGFHQWTQQHQQQQHCFLPQIPQSTSTPITWTR